MVSYVMKLINVICKTLHKEMNAFINITDPEQIGIGLAKVHLKDIEEMGCLE